MLVNNRITFAVIGIVLSWFAVWGIAEIVEARSPNTKVSVCDSIEQGELQIDCVYRVLNKELHDKGLEQTMEVFSAAYNRFQSFSSTGCHRHAHRVGDMVYYELYLQGNGFDSIDFSQETVSCGYGLFHGFLEHLIQDNPDTDFVTETCDYLDNELGDTMRAIRITCYHGSGHGFMLDNTERVGQDKWGNIDAFIDNPIKLCEALPEANKGEIEECLQGVFNVLVDWMADDEYGFSYDDAQPFESCDRLLSKYHHACYYEMAQKLDFLSGNDPRIIAEITSSIESKELRRVAFEIAIAGVIQQTISIGFGYEKTLEMCGDLDDETYGYCINSIVHGLFEHGEPQNEYTNVLIFCAEDAISERGLSETCHKRIARRLTRFYSAEKIESICRKFPNEYRLLCEEKIEQKQG